jgi:heavy metal efflux system protein
MMRTIIAGVLHQRLVIVVVSLILLAFGVNAAQHLSVDAFPDVTNVQVQIATEAQGKSPEEVERFITVPIEIGMTGLPGLTDMRSLNKPGLSLITLVFEDGKGVYFERQLVSERLNELREHIPEGVSPVLGPVSNALGEVYQYTLENPDDGKRPLTHDELVERRTIQDWIVRPLLRSIPGVAEINSTGGYVKEYQTLVDPQKLRNYGLAIGDVYNALKRNNENAGGGILPQHAEQYLIRSIGLIRNVDDIRNIVLKESAGTPVYIRNVAEVRVGEQVRYGAMVKGGYTESVGGVVMMTAGGNAKEIVTRIKQRVAEINGHNTIPGGLRIMPYYDRSRLVDAAIHTVTEVLAEGIVLVVVVLFLHRGDLRSSLVVSANLVLTPLLTFLIMNHIGLSANLMSLGRLAIAIGLMVDGSVVVVENVFGRLGHGSSSESRLHVVRDAIAEVATPVIFGVTIIVLVFLPLMTLEGTEGKMFAPLAYTIAIALLLSLVLFLSLSPALSMFWLKGGKEEDTHLVRWLRTPYQHVLRWAMQNKAKSVIAVVLLFVISLGLVPFLGTAFIPEMQEGTLGPNADRVPNISLDESIKMELHMQGLMRDIPGVENVVSRLGRGESPADPAGPNEADVIANLTPVDERPRELTQEKSPIKCAMRLRRFPAST